MLTLLTDGNQRATLAVVRSLGRGGHQVAVTHSVESCLAGASKYCHGTVIVPSLQNEPERFRESLLAEVRSGRYEMMIPMTDEAMQVVVSQHAEFAKHVLLPVPGPDQIRIVQDKAETFKAAQRAGIDVPRTYHPQNDSELRSLGAEVKYPVVIKPRFSKYLDHGKWQVGRVEFAHNANELLLKYQEAHGSIPFPLVQEQVSGEGRGVFLLIWDGRLKAAFCHRRLREKPPWGGVSVLCESVSLDQEIVQRSFAFLKAIGWQGVAMVEFKKDDRDGTYRLMEVNGRFWGSLQLAVDSGMDFPMLLYRHARGEDLPPRLEYRAGVKSRWFLGDMDNLLIRLRHGERTGETSLPSRLRACAQFLKMWEPGLHYEVLRWEDTGPGWQEWKTYLGQFRPRPRAGVAA